jgi:hypothetical protein
MPERATNLLRLGGLHILPWGYRALRYPAQEQRRARDTDCSMYGRGIEE